MAYMNQTHQIGRELVEWTQHGSRRDGHTVAIEVLAAAHGGQRAAGRSTRWL